MSDIEVGEYIRTKYGVIAKLECIEEDADEEYKFYVFGNTLYRDYGEPIDFLIEDEIESDVKAHSKNIIDLIEVGDYVNGEEVIIVYGYDEEGNDKDNLGICLVDDDYAYYKYLEEIDIKTIVTKEQFNSIKYEVE